MNNSQSSEKLNRDQKDRPALTVLAMLALRPSELCGLVYESDVSWKSSELIVQRVCWRGSLHPFPKANKVRRVAFGSTVRAILEGQRVSASQSRHGTIFSGRGGGLLDAKILNVEFKAACQRAGIVLPEGGDGLYSLRHSALSSWLEAGIDPATVASLAGHGIRTLLAVYAHPHKANAHKAAKVMEDAMMRNTRDVKSEVA